MTRPIASFVVLALLLAGCSKAVQITAPTSSPLTAPLTAFTVKFSTFFAAGSFTAQFDGTDVTPGFVPAAAPGGTSTMKVSDSWDGLTGGTQVGGGPQGRDPIPVGTGSGTSSGPRTSGVAPPTGGGSGGGGTGPATPNIAIFSHQLHVSAQCNGLICDTVDDFAFVPIHLFGNPLALNLRVGQKALATVEAYPAIKTPLTVRLRPFNVAISLDGSAPGAPIFRTIPPGGASAPFTITGLVSAPLAVIIEAPGVQMGSIQGVINP